VNKPSATPISLTLPSLEVKALAHFVKRIDFDTVASLSSVTVVSDGKSEADFVWLALIELRRALAEGGVTGVTPQATRPRVAPLTVVHRAG
jgi:hypothetical protein